MGKAKEHATSGFVTELTSAGPRVLQRIPDVDWYHREGNTVDFMRGHQPGLTRDVLVDLESPHAVVVATVKLREGWSVHVGESNLPTK